MSHVITCVECNDEFIAKTKSAKRCSDECKKIAARRRASEHYTANGRVSDYGSTDCSICGIHFKRARWRETCCSQQCRDANQKRLTRSWYDNNRELANQRSRDWHAANYDYSKSEARRRILEETRPEREARRRERDRESAARWRRDNPGRAAELKRIAKERNPEKYRATNKAWRQANAEKVADNKRKWNAANPDKRAAGHRKSRMQRRNAVRTNAYVDSEVFERDGWTCYLCGKPIDPKADRRKKWGAQIEHVVPISRGGVDGEENVRAAHRRCNFMKHNSLLEELALPFAGPTDAEIAAFA